MSIAVTVCPPMAARGAIVEKPFAHRAPMIVSAQTGIGWENRDSFQIQTHKSPRVRIIAAAGWPFNEHQRRAVILEFMRARCKGFNPLRIPIEGDERQQFQACCAILRSQVPPLTEALDSLCRESTAPDVEPERRRILEIEIQNIDRRLCIASSPDIFERLLYLHFNMGLDSEAVSLDTGLSPFGVRTIISRMNRTARALGFEAPRRAWKNRLAKPPKPPRLCACGAPLYRSQQKCLACKNVKPPKPVTVKPPKPPKPPMPVVMCSVCKVKAATKRRRWLTCSPECSAIRNRAIVAAWKREQRRHTCR